MQYFARNLDILTQGLKSGKSGLMSDTTQTSGSSSEVYYVNFNQDCTSLAVGTRKGYKLYSLTIVNSLSRIYKMNYKDVCIVERLFSSSLVAFVSLKCPRNLKVCHFRKGTEICNYSYSNTILAVKLNRARLIVCLEECLFIHNIRDMKVLHTIRDTPPNPSGLVTLAIPPELSFLAYPGSNTIGEVQIFDANNLHAKIMIPAHNSPLAALAFSPSGKEIATASEKGTVIRVFAIQDGSKLYEFRRGVKRCVSISSLVFSTDSNYLCCSSNTETVHIFKLDEAKETAQPGVEDNQGWIGYLAKAVSVSANYLPTQVTGVFNQGRAFASVHLPFQGVRTVCALTKIQRMLRLFVATTDGYLYMYELDPCEGGDGVLAKQFRIGVNDTSTPVEGSQPDEKIEPLSPTQTPPKETPNPESVSDYAGVLKGRPPGGISGIGTEVIHEIASALESPSSGVILRLHDDNEFPPVTQSADSKYHGSDVKKKGRQEDAKIIYY